MCKKTLFLSLFLEKRGQIWKKSKRSWCGHQLRTMTYFSKYHTFDPLLYLGCQMLRTHFFFPFSGKNRSNNKIFGKKILRASTRSHDPFFDHPKIWPTFIYPYHQFFKSSCACSNSWPTKKNIRASTRTHDPFFDNPEIWPTFIYRGEVPAHTFAKLPVRALINDPKKNWYRNQLQPMPHFLTTPKFDLLSYIYIINFFNLPVRALIHDLQKKTYGHQLGPMTHFLTTPKFDLLLYIGEKCLHTHLQSFLCVP